MSIHPTLTLHAGECAGDLLRTSASTPELVAFEVGHVAGAFPRHAHERARIALLLEGSIAEGCDGRVDALPRGSLVFWREGATHDDVFAPATRSLQVELSPELYRYVAKYFPPPPTPILIDRFEGAAQRLIAEIERADAATPLALQAAVYEILARATRLTSTAKPVSFGVNQAMRYATEHLSDAITLDDLAQAANLSVRSLRERFADELQTSPMEYVRSLRLRQAEVLLRRTELPASEVGQQCGFYDQTHFCRVFRQHSGMTPTAFRARR
jgi:AraC family transcriptional regulator